MNILFVVLFVNQSRYRSQKSGYSKIIEIHISLFGNQHNFFERKKNKQKKTWKITFWKNYDNLALCARAYQSGFFFKLVEQVNQCNWLCLEILN